MTLNKQLTDDEAKKILEGLSPSRCLDYDLHKFIGGTEITFNEDGRTIPGYITLGSSFNVLICKNGELVYSAYLPEATELFRKIRENDEKT